MRGRNACSGEVIDELLASQVLNPKGLVNVFGLNVFGREVVFFGGENLVDNRLEVSCRGASGELREVFGDDVSMGRRVIGEGTRFEVTRVPVGRVSAQCRLVPCESVVGPRGVARVPPAGPAAAGSLLCSVVNHVKYSHCFVARGAGPWGGPILAHFGPFLAHFCQF